MRTVEEWTVKVNEALLHLIKRICSVKVKTELWVSDLLNLMQNPQLI